jgi:hypothetical protein
MPLGHAHVLPDRPCLHWSDSVLGTAVLMVAEAATTSPSCIPPKSSLQAARAAPTHTCCLPAWMYRLRCAKCQQTGGPSSRIPHQAASHLQRKRGGGWVFLHTRSPRPLPQSTPGVPDTCALHIMQVENSGGGLVPGLARPAACCVRFCAGVAPCSSTPPARTKPATWRLQNDSTLSCLSTCHGNTHNGKHCSWTPPILALVLADLACVLQMYSLRFELRSCLTPPPVST